MEHIMEVIATALNKDATEVKQLNFYKDGEVHIKLVLNFLDLIA